MDLITIRELYRNKENYLDKNITVGGWVRSVRDSKTFGFIVLNDGTFFETLQIVYSDNLNNFNEISKLNVGSAIIVTGKLVATPQAKQPFEIQAEEVFIEGESTPDYPLQKKRHTLEYLRTITESAGGVNMIAEKSGNAVKKTLEGYEHLRESETSLKLLKELIEKFNV